MTLQLLLYFSLQSSLNINSSSETQGLLAGMMRYFRAKVYFKSWRALGNSFLPNQFQKWSNSVPLIGQKNILLANQQSRSQRPRSFWLATGIATYGQLQLQLQKSAIHGHPVTLRMLRVKFNKSDWFWSQSIVFTEPFKTRMFFFSKKKKQTNKQTHTICNNRPNIVDLSHRGRTKVKALVIEDTMMRTHCSLWCFLGCANWETFVADTKYFWTKSETYFVFNVRNKCCARGQMGKHLCRQQCVRNNVSSFAMGFRL